MESLPPVSRLPEPACRFCGTPLDHTLVDLGMSPPCERFVTADMLPAMEPFHPLRVYVCPACLLVQLPEHVAPDDIFREYAYFSSYSTSWLDHARRYVDVMAERLALGPDDLVVELGSNDGYLLQYVAERGIPALGIEPALNVADAARARGLEVVSEFFGRSLAERLVAEGRRASLVVANNVLAQVPDLNDFVAGIATLLRPDGTVTIEVPHLLHLIERNEFDTIYHEHYSYFSLGTTVRILAAHGLTVTDVEELATHGGSLRIHAQPAAGAPAPGPRVAAVLEQERAAGQDRLEGYASFAERVVRVKHDLLTLLIGLRREGLSIAGYGAPGKGNTLLNYCGIREDLVEYLVDRNPYKHGRFTPGTHIPIHPPERLAETRPDVILILPWNLRDEIVEQLAYTRAWGARFVVPIPSPALV